MLLIVLSQYYRTQIFMVEVSPNAFPYGICVGATYLTESFVNM